MEVEYDEDRGARVGSRIHLKGRVFGVALSVDEIVIEREPPTSKLWETTGTPKLLVIGSYRMGFTLSQRGAGSMLHVFIKYALPETPPSRWAGFLFARYYAKWCTQQMVDDAAKYFAG
jgi:hypothetical protein